MGLLDQIKALVQLPGAVSSASAAKKQSADLQSRLISTLQQPATKPSTGSGLIDSLSQRPTPGTPPAPLQPPSYLLPHISGSSLFSSAGSSQPITTQGPSFQDKGLELVMKGLSKGFENLQNTDPLYKNRVISEASRLQRENPQLTSQAAIERARQTTIQIDPVGAVGELRALPELLRGGMLGRLAEETNPAKLGELLRKVKVPEELIPDLSTTLSKTSNPEKVQSLVEDAVKNFDDAAQTVRTPQVKLHGSVMEPESASDWMDAIIADVEKNHETVRKVNAAKPTQNEGFFQSLKNVLSPIKSTDEETQSIFRTWFRDNLIAKEKANFELPKLHVSEAEGLDTILRYERGSAMAHTADIRKEFDKLYDEANRRGLNFRFRQNYLPQIYKNTPEEIQTAVSKWMFDKGVSAQTIKEYLDGVKELPTELVTRLKLNPSFIKERVFPDYKTAMEYGLRPRFTNPAQLLAYYRHELEKTVANKKFLNDLVSKGKLVTAGDAPTGWKPVELPFSPKGYYAEPNTAKMLNGIFRDENNLGFGEKLAQFFGNVSKKAQEITLSAGAPKTDVNFFSIGQLIKELVSGNVKAVPAFVRANSSEATIRFFTENAEVLKKMAGQGIDLSARTGNYQHVYDNLTKNPKLSGRISEFVGDKWEKWFNAPTFASFMPQLYVQTFKDATEKAITKGMSARQAEQFAGEVTKNAFGLMENVGRSKAAEDTLSALFFAPKFREGVVRTLANTARGAITGVAHPMEFLRDLGPSPVTTLYKNRRLFTGLVLTYAAYNLANKKLSGHWMWENPAGNEFDLQIPMENGDNVFIGYMPSFLAFARNMASGVIATGKGDFSTAKQKFGSLASMPIQLATELWANRDYFGREIYKDTDSGTEKLQKMATYAFLDVNHPYIREVFKQITTDKPLYQSFSEALELPLKFKSNDQIARNQFYDAMDKQTQKRADEKKRVQPIYDKVQALAKEGKEDEARAIVDGLSDDDYEIYKAIKTADKSRATKRGEADMYDTVLQVRKLVDEGKSEDAQAIVDNLSDEEYRLYQLAKKKAE